MLHGYFAVLHTNRIHSLNIPSPLVSNTEQVNTQLLETICTAAVFVKRMRSLGQIRIGVQTLLLLIRKDGISDLYPMTR